MEGPCRSQEPVTLIVRVRMSWVSSRRRTSSVWLSGSQGQVWWVSTPTTPRPSKKTAWTLAVSQWTVVQKPAWTGLGSAQKLMLGVGDGVMLGVGVFVGVAVDVGVLIGVAVGVGVLVGVAVDVGVFVGVAVGASVPVGVAVGVLVGVTVGASVPVGVVVGVLVGIDVLVGVAVGGGSGSVDLYVCAVGVSGGVIATMAMITRRPTPITALAASMSHAAGEGPALGTGGLRGGAGGAPGSRLRLCLVTAAPARSPMASRMRSA